MAGLFMGGSALGNFIGGSLGDRYAKKYVVAIALAQHFPFNQHGFFAAFQTGYYQALK